MPSTKVIVGSSAKHLRFWMDGTREEIKAKLAQRFRVYDERPVKGKEPRVAKPKAGAVPVEASEAPGGTGD